MDYYKYKYKYKQYKKLYKLLKGGGLKYEELEYHPMDKLYPGRKKTLEKKYKKWLEKGSITFAYQNIKESRIQRKFGSLDRSYRNEMVNIFSVNGDFSVPIKENQNRLLTYGFELAYNDVTSNAFGKTLAVSTRCKNQRSIRARIHHETIPRTTRKTEKLQTRTTQAKHDKTKSQHDSRPPYGRHVPTQIGEVT